VGELGLKLGSCCASSLVLQRLFLGFVSKCRPVFTASRGIASVSAGATARCFLDLGVFNGWQPSACDADSACMPCAGTVLACLDTEVKFASARLVPTTSSRCLLEGRSGRRSMERASSWQGRKCTVSSDEPDDAYTEAGTLVSTRFASLHWVALGTSRVQQLGFQVEFSAVSIVDLRKISELGGGGGRNFAAKGGGLGTTIGRWQRSRRPKVPMEEIPRNHDCFFARAQPLESDCVKRVGALCL